MNGICKHCGQDVHLSLKEGVWVHDSPLGELKVSKAEAADVMADPPPASAPLDRKSYIHHAGVDRSV